MKTINSTLMTCALLSLMACKAQAPKPAEQSTAPKATLVVTAVPKADQMASVREYLKGVMPLLRGAGGALVRRLKTDTVVNGRPTGMVLVMDFPSADAASALFESAAYRALVPARDRGFAEINILITRGM